MLRPLTEAQANALLVLARSPWATAAPVTTGTKVALKNRGYLASERVQQYGHRFTNWHVTYAGRDKVVAIEAERRDGEQRRRESMGSATVPLWAALRLLGYYEGGGPDCLDEARRALRVALGVDDE
ncbi:MAG: hypothetical protein Q8Q14_04690 [Gemmatimonadales bacterium]|nr:hypothetical protein [Gemmatimonadales bacterium]